MLENHNCSLIKQCEKIVYHAHIYKKKGHGIIVLFIPEARTSPLALILFFQGKVERIIIISDLVFN